MKKIQFLYFAVISMLFFIAFSCNKSDLVFVPLETNNNDTKRNEATWETSQDNAKGWLAKLKIYIGHTADQCGGKCMKIFGEYLHLDCRGYGNVCNMNSKSILSIGENEEELILTIIDEDIFFGESLEFSFPDRSLYITNPQNSTDLWLNIPEQLLVRENADEDFIIHNVWFSENQELENN